MNRRDILPFKLGKIRKPTKTSSRRRRNRRSRRVRVETAVSALLEALNWLCQGRPIRPNGRRSEEPAVSSLARTYLYQRCQVACRRGLLEVPAAAESYGGVNDGYIPRAGLLPTVLNLDINLLSLPGEGIAGSVQLEDVLNPEKVAQYCRPSSHLILKPNKTELLNTSRVIMVKNGGYEDLIHGLMARGILDLQNSLPIEINGMFAVPKDGDKQRLIIDARRANLHFVAPAAVELPNPGILTQLKFPGSAPLSFCKLDVDNFYHRLQLPAHLRTYFGLPRIQYKGKWRWPRLRVFTNGLVTFRACGTTCSPDHCARNSPIRPKLEY